MTHFKITSVGRSDQSVGRYDKLADVIQIKERFAQLFGHSAALFFYD